MSVVAEFESIQKELSTLKPPGVSGSRIKRLTDLAVRSVSEESKLISSLYSNCKATPSTNKLGSLYVVDSIVRVYKDEAKKRGETIDASAPEGTFAAGVYKITELIESIVDDALELLINAGTNQKIGKLVDIWERAQTFEPELLARIKDKHFRSTTPPGTPPHSAAVPQPSNSSNTTSDAASTASNAPSTDNNSGSVLLALASLAKKNENPTPPNAASPPVQNAPPAAPANNAANNILSQLSALANNNNSPSTSSPTPPSSQPFQAAPAPAAPPAAQTNKDQIFSMLQLMQGPKPASPYQQHPNMASNTPPSVPPIPGRPPIPAVPAVPGMPPMPLQGFNNNNNRGAYDRRGREDGAGYLRRNRSRSPNGRHGSPQNQDRSLSHGFLPADGEANVPGAPHFRPRNVGFDNSLPQGSFKVLSRTLFIGGVPFNMDERALASHLRPYAEVQSVILNSERKHAFVKVYSRAEAEQVIQSFNKDGALPLRTRWGVGFGPRDCCNYQHGISIIPIERLTDADRQWVVQAQWGGTGGQPLMSGMVVDEPDIEIGTGISSKAMSKKMPTNSTRNGPKSNRPGESDDQYAKTGMNLRPDFLGYNSGVPNPLAGLFQQPVQMGMQQGMPPQGMPPQGMPPQGMPPQGMPPQGMPPQGYPPQMGANNLSAQLANFFQNGGGQQ